MAGNLVAQVNFQERVHIQLPEGEIQVSGQTVLQTDRALDFQIRFVELGVSLDRKLTAVGSGIHVEVPGALFVESQIAKMDVGFHRRLLDRTCTPNREVSLAIHGDAVTLQFGEAREVQVTTRKADVERIARCTHRGASAHRSAVEAALQVVELKLAIRQAEIAAQERDWCAIRTAVADLQPALPVRTCARARGAHREVQSSSQGVVAPRQLLQHAGPAPRRAHRRSP